MQITQTQMITGLLSIQEQLKDFGLNPRDWKINLKGSELRLTSKDPKDSIEMCGRLKSFVQGHAVSFKIQSLELLPF